MGQCEVVSVLGVELFRERIASLLEAGYRLVAVQSKQTHTGVWYTAVLIQDR
ncbi:MAG: hypothetical protein O3A46_02880 [Candidatus Poribacteria bacterium]|nr:hypothetical protein [Candidatus Poribacteria bacterium]